MRTFRITLSHGSESITFDGAGARSGSMFHVRRDAIEGLWSSPASKVSLTERETANGASPISDGETLYAARTVTIPFAIQSNYNHTDLIRARILLGRLIGWHDVRMDINDDGDETVLYGYIEAKYSDIPYDHADTGTITLVCPDPRRVSKRASTISMNTSSSSLDGLSFGVPAYDLAWTGTPNASPSTLSQDGAVIATNLFPTTRLASADMGNTSITQTADGFTITTNKTYTGFGDDHYLNTSNEVAGETYHLHAETDNVLTTTLPDLSIWGCDESWDGVVSVPNTYISSPSVIDIDLPSNARTVARISLKCGMTAGDHVTWRRLGLYTAADWNAMKALGVSWFDGGQQSPQPNTGLVFPLNFGQTGNAGNTGMIANNGSYVAMPTITAHGWLDSGLTIHWNTSDGHEGDLSFNGNVGNVPVTINTDTHSAIIGGLDVSYQLGSRDWPRIPAGGSCSFALLASGNGWVTVQSHDTYM